MLSSLAQPGLTMANEIIPFRKPKVVARPVDAKRELQFAIAEIHRLSTTLSIAKTLAEAGDYSALAKLLAGTKL